MDAEHAAHQFVALFHQLFLRFHSRDDPGDYLPSPETIAILEHLARTGPLTVGEAARHFRRSQSTISEIVARLESRGLLERMADRRDRRRTLVWLTAEGQRVLAKAQRVLDFQRLKTAWASWEPTRRSELLERLEELLQPGPLDPLSNRKDDDHGDSM